MEVTVTGQYQLTEHGFLSFTYQLPDGSMRYGQDVTERGFLFDRFASKQPHTVTNAELLPEALSTKERLITERQTAKVGMRARLLAGEPLLVVSSNNYDGWAMPVLGMSRELVSTLGDKAAYDLVTSLLPWMGMKAVGAPLPAHSKSMGLISIPQLQELCADRYTAWATPRKVELATCRFCGHQVPESQMMSASLGLACPDCYDKASN